MTRVSTLGVDASSIGGAAVSASHTLIDVNITVRAFEPAQPRTLGIFTTKCLVALASSQGGRCSHL